MNFSHVVARHAERTPDRLAIVAPEGRVTYAQLEDRVQRLAAGFASLGVEAGDRIALLLGNGLPFLEAHLATLRLGAWSVPLNWRLAAEEVAYAVEHSGVRLLVTEDRYAATAAASGARVVTTGVPEEADWTVYERLLERGRSRAVAPVAMDDVQRIMYTSGTTARPKGALLTNGQIWWGGASRAVDFGLSAADVGLVVAPLYHVGGLDSYTTAMLYLGGTTVVLPRFDAERVLDAIARERVTNCWLAPTMLSMIFELPEHERIDVASLRTLLIGGEKAPMPLLERLGRDWPATSPYNAYGLTECQGIATYLDPAEATRKLGSVGRAAWMREVTLLDEQGGAVLDGAPGEIAVRGPLVFAGYHDDPAATADALRDGWLRTGDVGVVDEEGFLYVVDRKKDMILSGGENIASQEIERVIHELPEVLEAAVVAMAHPKWGEVPAAFVVARGGHALDEAHVLAHCDARLARFKVPKLVRVVGELPRTPSGKVLKRALREQVDDAAAGGGQRS